MTRVAVTGFGVVSPIGNGREDFWQSLASGVSGIDLISGFDCSTLEVRLAGEVRQPVALPGNVSAVAARDPKVGFGYAAAAEAMLQAGISHLDANSLLHLAVSVEILDLARICESGEASFKAMVSHAIASDATLQIPLDTLASALISAYGRPGRALTNCSACAASAQAIGHAFREVRAGRCTLAVCGGHDSMINPLGVGAFQLLGALTTDNERGASACRPFDASRTGAVLGEGAAVSVLEPMDKAQAEGKPVLAEICGYGSTLDGYSVTAPDPQGDGAARATQAALDDAGLRPQDIGHINAHGTGTLLNDEVEATAIRRVFQECWQDIPVSSTKSVTGHLIAAAGAVEFGACLLALNHSILPANPWLNRIGAGCELDHVVGSPRRFDGEYVLSNSFGFGGQNAVLIARRYHGS